jgi:hypothetical protein
MEGLIAGAVVFVLIIGSEIAIWAYLSWLDR